MHAVLAWQPVVRIHGDGRLVRPDATRAADRGGGDGRISRGVHLRMGVQRPAKPAIIASVWRPSHRGSATDWFVAWASKRELPPNRRSALSTLRIFGVASRRDLPELRLRHAETALVRVARTISVRDAVDQTTQRRNSHYPSTVTAVAPEPITRRTPSYAARFGIPGGVALDPSVPQHLVHRAILT